MPDELQYLESLKGSGIRPGLERMRALLRAAGDPHHSCRAVLVAGTNGKGSTAATLHSILLQAGYRSGLYTSPHLVGIRERWRIGNEEIDEASFLAAIRKLRAAASEAEIEPTYFEALTVLAFIAFAESGREIAVLEVGMGGRLDATNVVLPELALISRIGRDHTEYLGETIEEIAAEKGGIIHPGSLAATSNDSESVLRVLRERAAGCGVELHLVQAESSVTAPDVSPHGMSFSLRTPVRSYLLTTPLRGMHQLENISLAVRGAELLSERFERINSDSIESGVARTAWRGRLEHFSVAERTVVVDGGHNEQAIRKVVDFLRQQLPRPRTLVFGMMEDKEPQDAFPLLLPLFDHIIVTQPDDSRATPVSVLRQIARTANVEVEAIEVNESAFARALQIAGASVLICGSLYIAGSAIAFLDRIAAAAAAESVSRESRIEP